jgi:hypothetical protein
VEICGLELQESKNKILYTKECFTCTTSIVDQQTPINHTVVNALSKSKHIYPYGGYLGSDGILGDALYMMLTPNITNTHINIRSYQDLLHQNINVFDPNCSHAFQLIDPAERHKILPLQSLIEQGEIGCELQTKAVDDIWIQSYKSESLVRKDGTYEGVLTLRRNGKPTLRRVV